MHEKKVFLGGTCNDSDWRDKLIPLLKVNYFNPVVEDWTEECQKKEIQERQTCDICLYTITPKMAGIYSIAEVVDDSNKRPKKTVLVLLNTDRNSMFREPQWKSLMALGKMIVKNGSQVFYNLNDAADYINKVLKEQN